MSGAFVELSAPRLLESICASSSTLSQVLRIGYLNQMMAVQVSQDKEVSVLARIVPIGACIRDA